MAISIDTSAGGLVVATVADSSSNTSISVSRPANTVDGDLLLFFLASHNALNPNSVTPPVALTTLESNYATNGNFTTHAFLGSRVASSEASTYAFTIGADARDDAIICVRVVGAGGVVDSVLTEAGSTVNPSSPAITATSAGDALLCFVAMKNGSGTITSSPPSSMTTANIGRSRATSFGLKFGLAYQLSVGVGDTGVKTWTSFTDNGQPYVGVSVVISEAPSGPTVSSITSPIIGTEPVTIVLSEAAPTVDTIEFTVGAVTQSQSYTTGDDTTFTIASVTRNLLPPIGTVTVELKAGATVIATTTATLQQAVGYSAVTGVGVDDGLAAPHTGVLTSGDIALVSDHPNTSLDAAFTNFAQTIPGPFTVEVWDASEEAWGASSFFTIASGQVRYLRALPLSATALAATALPAESL